jgi:ATP-dependent RNA helicase DDX51/DBP6
VTHTCVNWPQQFYVSCSAGEKPIIILHMLLNLGIESSLCFTSSVQATHRYEALFFFQHFSTLLLCFMFMNRLYLLLQHFPVKIAEFSGSLKPKERAQIIQNFKEGKIKMIICSDVMARGLDIEEVQNVINYDSPKFVRTYVHRCGRTARAGRPGTAFSLVKTEQLHRFQQEILQKIHPNNVTPFEIEQQKIQAFIPDYETALEKLRQAVEQEKIAANIKA